MELETKRKKYYNKILLTGDFSTKIYDHNLETFLYQHELKSFVEEKNCFKSVSNPVCMNLFLKNNALSFKSSKTVSTGLSEFHKLVLNHKKYSVEIINILTTRSLIGIWKKNFHVNM